jgi:hypothetical protein
MCWRGCLGVQDGDLFAFGERQACPNTGAKVNGGIPPLCRNQRVPTLGGPDASSWAPGRLDIFARGDDFALWRKEYDGGWSSWEHLQTASVPHRRARRFVVGTGGVWMSMPAVPTKRSGIGGSTPTGRVGSHWAPRSPPTPPTAVLRDPLTLWRGHPFADLPDSERLVYEARRVEELRLRAIERRVEAELVRRVGPRM